MARYWAIIGVAAGADMRQRLERGWRGIKEACREEENEKNGKNTRQAGRYAIPGMA
jgi:hypothetical protein